MAYTPPKYYIVKQAILEKIQSGELKHGEAIPSERELMLTQDVSRITVRKAVEELEQEGYVTVRFLEDQREITAPIEIVQNGTEFFGVISFNNSVPAYATERFIEIELITQEETGLKIPLSSLVRKEFYLVPVEYALFESGEDSYYFIRKRTNILTS